MADDTNTPNDVAPAGSDPNPPSPSEPTVPHPVEPGIPNPTEPTVPNPDEPGPPVVESSDERYVRGTGSPNDLSVLAEDVAHPFDQTNGIIDGLEGDADQPERVSERLGDENDFERAFDDPDEVDYDRAEETAEDEAP